jgi:hypothetical protein
MKLYVWLYMSRALANILRGIRIKEISFPLVAVLRIWFAAEVLF